MFNISKLPTKGNLSLSNTFDTVINTTTPNYTFETPLYYKGNLNYFGVDFIEYIVRDASGVNSPYGTAVQINVVQYVAPVQDLPRSPQHTWIDVPENTINLLSIPSGTDSNGSTPYFTLTRLPPHGTLSTSDTLNPPSLALDTHYSFSSSYYFHSPPTDGLANWWDYFEYRVVGSTGLISAADDQTKFNIRIINTDQSVVASDY